MRDSRPLQLFILTLFIGLILAGFSLVYHGRWWEEDSDINIIWIREVVRQESFTRARSMYLNGYGYHVVSAMYTMLAGVDPAPYVRLANPVLGLIVALAAYTLYARILGRGPAPIIAVAALFTVPEIIFASARGTHEKFTFTFIILIIFMILELAGGVERRGASIVALTLAYGLSSMNAYFAIIPGVLLASSIVSMVLLHMLFRETLESDRNAARVTWSVLSNPNIVALIVLIPLLNLAYVIRGQYLVVHGYGQILSNIMRGLLDYIFGVEKSIVQQYNIQSAYDPRVFFLLESPGLILALGAAASMAYTILYRRVVEGADAIALMAPLIAGLGVAADLAGGLYGSKTLIVRVIPLTAILGAPAYARLLAAAASRGRVAMALLIVSLALLAGAGFLKATKSPLVSRHIPYYTVEEEAVAETLVEWDRGLRVYFDSRYAGVVYTVCRDVDYYYLYVKRGSPFQIYYNDPSLAEAYPASALSIERGYYRGLYPLPPAMIKLGNSTITLSTVLEEGDRIVDAGRAWLVYNPSPP